MDFEMAGFIACFLLAGMLLCIELGYRFGRKRRSKLIEAGDGIGTVDAAVFGLLGLILAFTFSGAYERLNIRRAQIVDEANAIGTAYLRIDTLPASEQQAIRGLFRDYLEARIEVYEKFLDRAASKAALDKAAKLQNEIWTRSVAACRIDSHPSPCMLLLPALNAMIDITTTRTMAAYTHVPAIIIILMLLLSLFAALLSGYALSGQQKRNVLHMFVFALTISLAVYVVLDLEFPRAGFINLKAMDEAIVQLRGTIK